MSQNYSLSSQRPNTSQLSVGQLQGAFLLLLLAHAVSFTCFTAEFMWAKKVLKEKKLALMEQR